MLFLRMNVFITGISSGVGRELARQLLFDGHAVWGIARRGEELASFAAEMATERLRTTVCDVQDHDVARAVVQTMRDTGWLPDVVVLNAGIYVSDVHDTFDFDAHRTSFGVNLDGALFWVAEFLSDFLARGSGTFIAISSTAAFRPSGSASYSASKSALSMAFRQLRLSFTDRGVVFSTVHFGPIATRLWPGRRLFLVPSPAHAAAFVRQVCGRRAGSYFYPRLTTTLLRLSAFIPDRAFRWWSARLLRSNHHFHGRPS